MMITDIQTTDTQGGVTHDEVQTVTLTNATNGTFRLAFKGQTTAELAYNATPTQVINALTDLSSTDQLSVSGTAGGPWQITFVGTHTGINQPSLNGDAAALISGTEIREMDYSYDASSQLSSASDPDSAYAYTYDNLGQVLTVDSYGTPDVPNVVLTSAYNAAGRRTSLTPPRLPVRLILRIRTPTMPCIV